jgi:N utilization substance protein B
MTNPGAKARSIARLAAVQALYQMDIAETDLSDVFSEFYAGKIAHGIDGLVLDSGDSAHFLSIVKGVVDAQGALDPAIDRVLDEKWSLMRLDATLRAILRAGAFELDQRHDVPFKTVINEYIELARAFFDDTEPGIVNGVLDTLARKYRDIA